MRKFLSLVIIMFVLLSCGKKSDPKYQGSIINLTKTI